MSGVCEVSGAVCPDPLACRGGCIRCTGTAQAEFDQRYISSTELCLELGVTRATLVNGRRRGALPRNCVLIKRRNGDPHIILWLRDEAGPYVDRWKVELGKGALAA